MRLLIAIAIAGCGGPPTRPVPVGVELAPVAWRSDTIAGPDVLALDADHLYVARRGDLPFEIRVFAVRDGERVGASIRSTVWPERFALAPRGPGPCDRMVLATQSEIIALTPDGELWHTRYPGLIVDGLVADDAHVLVVIAGLWNYRLVLDLDPATGVERWRVNVPGNWVVSRVAVDGGHGLVVGRAEPPRLDTTGLDLELEITTPTVPLAMDAFGVDLETGRTLWSYHAAPASAVASDPTRLVIARRDALSIIDRASGLALDVDLPFRIDPRLGLANDVAFIAGPRDPGELDDAGDGFVIAVDLRLRRPRVLAHLPAMSGGDVVATDAAVFFQQPDGTILALDRWLGQPRWTREIGAKTRLLATSDRMLVADSFSVTAFAPH